jgi:hypothetical protein
VTHKVASWVVVRFEQPALEHTDYVSVKGVYDSPEEAYAAAERSAASRPPHETQYRVFTSRRFVSDRPERGTPEGAAQRFSDNAPDTERRWQWQSLSLLGGTALHDVIEALPSDVKRQVVQPLLAYYAEFAVARMLGAVEWPAKDDQTDIRLQDGTRVEVKLTFLNPRKPRAPLIQYRAGVVDMLALILVTADLQLVAARLIPRQVLSHFERSGPHTREGALMNIRVTPDLMYAPGTSRIDLGAAAP